LQGAAIELRFADSGAKLKSTITAFQHHHPYMYGQYRALRSEGISKSDVEML